MLLIVPNSLSAELYRRIDAEIAKVPDAAKDREALYRQLLAYFNEHGVIPDFALVRTTSAEAPDADTMLAEREKR